MILSLELARVKSAGEFEHEVPKTHDHGSVGHLENNGVADQCFNVLHGGVLLVASTLMQSKCSKSCSMSRMQS